jgi:hypothetical protein
MVWESPIYRFKTDVDGQKQEVLIDVTGSAPNFNKPGKQLIGTFTSLLKGLKPSDTKILDFGGAKLRNTLYLLKKGYTVYACEFEDLFKRSKQANDFWEKCKKFPNFKKLVFPKDFIEFDDVFDVVLLINVINIMPVPIERYNVLALCRKKIKEGGRLLWYTQHGMYSAKDAVAPLYDGLITGKGREYKMFYRDFTRKEIYDMLNASGFTFDGNFSFPTSGSNQAYAFKADGGILLEKSLGLSEKQLIKPAGKLEIIPRNTWKTSKIEKDPAKRIYETAIPMRTVKPVGINVLETYIEELETVKAGKSTAPKYHDIIFNILKLLFDKQLKKPIKEDPIANETQRVDITFQNDKEVGFFKRLDEGYHITCPNIYFECKNYKEDIANIELGQMSLRLNDKRGQFGIIVCRNIKNINKIKDRQNDLIKKGMYIIVLADKDIKKLVKFKLNGKEEEMNDLLEDKLKVLV